MHVLLSRLVWLVPVLALLAGCAGGPSPDAEIGTASNTYAELDRFALNRMRSVDIPGIAYAVVEPTGVVHTGTFGVDGDGAGITPATTFLWGSLAKPVTATLVTNMVERGELELDAPVTTYLPSFRLSDAARSARITIRQLLDQTSGIATSSRHTDRTDPGRRPADALVDLADDDLVSDPGATHHYSSTNYLVLSAVVEAVTGRPFVQVLTERVLRPFGMNSALTSAERAEQVLPRGHRFVFGQAVPFTSPYDPAGVGYGYLGGTLHDAAAFAAAALGGGTGAMTDEQRDMMFRGEVRTSEGKFYGLGWRRWTLPGADTPMVWHGGAGPGYLAQVILLPDSGRAVVLLANAFGSFHESALLETGWGLAQLAYGIEASTTDRGHSYAGILAALTVFAILLCALIISGVRLLIRPVVGGSPRWRIGAIGVAWLVVSCALLYGLGLRLPAALGIPLAHLVLWAPDLAWLVYGILGLTVTLLVVRSAVAIRTASRVRSAT